MSKMGHENPRVKLVDVNIKYTIFDIKGDAR